MANNHNPLASHFRVPKLYTELPSGGKFYDSDTLDFTENNEFPVFPMTAKDEIMLKNPDALLNGEAVAQVIVSCVPNIKKPRSLVSNDVDALLVAIQAATYGDELDVSGACPVCGETASAVLSAEVVLANVQKLEKDYQFTTNSGLLITMKPFSYETSVKAGVANFRSSRSLQSIEAIEDEVEKIQAFNLNFIELAKLNFELLVDSISNITIPATKDQESVTVSNTEHIREFLENADASISSELESFINEISEIGINKKMQLTCVPCSEKLPEDQEYNFESIVNFNAVNFFTAS